MFSSFIAPFITFVIAVLQIRWSSHEQRGIALEAPDREEQIAECLENAHQARLRFEVRLCRRRSGWLDHCEEARSELHTAQFDEVTESYRVVADRFGDEQEATAVGLPSRTEAIRVTRTLQDLPLSFLLRDEPDILSHPQVYLQVRTTFICRGGINRTLAHLSRVLTLGLVNTVEDRSLWEDFILTPRRTIAPR